MNSFFELLTDTRILRSFVTDQEAGSVAQELSELSLLGSSHAAVRPLLDEAVSDVM